MGLLFEVHALAVVTERRAAVAIAVVKSCAAVVRSPWAWVLIWAPRRQAQRRGLVVEA